MFFNNKYFSDTQKRRFNAGFTEASKEIVIQITLNYKQCCTAVLKYLKKITGTKKKQPSS